MNKDTIFAGLGIGSILIFILLIFNGPGVFLGSLTNNYSDLLAIPRMLFGFLAGIAILGFIVEKTRGASIWIRYGLVIIGTLIALFCLLLGLAIGIFGSPWAG